MLRIFFAQHDRPPHETDPVPARQQVKGSITRKYSRNTKLENVKERTLKNLKDSIPNVIQRHPVSVDDAQQGSKGRETNQ